MTEPAKNPELTKAIVKGAIVEAVLLAAGVALFFATNEIYWIIGATALGSGVMIYFMSQAGAFKQP